MNKTVGKRTSYLSADVGIYHSRLGVMLINRYSILISELLNNIIGRMVNINSRFYKPAEKYYQQAENFLEKNLSEGNITSEDHELILTFMNELNAQGISPTRYIKLVMMLVKNREYHPPYKECKIGDVQAVLQKIRMDKKEDGSPKYKQNTIADRVRILKRFFIWLSENEYISMDLKKLQKIRPPAFDRNTVTEEEILTEEEVMRFLDHCPNNRDKALFWILYEGALRVGEIGELRFKDVKITDTFLRITTDGKTGKVRHIPLVLSRQHYVTWINEYPGTITSESFVFVNRFNQQLTRASIAKQMRVIGKAAGIEKRLHPHLFRHSRITHLLQGDNPLQESHLKLLAWGDVNTNMLATYQHLSSTDLERSIAKINNIDLDGETDIPKKRGIKPIVCSNCGHINSPGTTLCYKCGTPLNEKGREAIENIGVYLSQVIMNNPELSFAAVEEMKKNGFVLPGK